MADNPFKKEEENRGPSWASVVNPAASVTPPVLPTPAQAAVAPVSPVIPVIPVATVAPVKTEVKKVLSAKEEEKETLLKKIGEILLEHGNMESNIHPRHDYWNLLHKYRAL